MSLAGRNGPSSWKLPLAVSSLLHLGIFALVLWPLARRVFERGSRPAYSIQIQVETAPQAPLAEAPAQRTRARSSDARGHARAEPPPAPVPLSRLGVRLFEPPPLPGSDVPVQEASAARETRGAGGAPDFSRESETNPLYAFIYQRIDSALPYPADLYSLGIDGSVQARLSFTKDGELLVDSVHYDASSRFLKVVVARALRLAFRDPIPARTLGLRSATTVSCLFRFQITEHNDESLKKSFRLSLEGQLAFYRNFQHSALQWDLGPLHGLGPFALGVDPMWFVTKIGDLLSKKAKIDPLDSYRDDPDW